MLNNLALQVLKRASLSQEEHLELLNIVNKQINSFPVGEVIQSTVDGAILANGQKLTIEEVVKFRQGISSLRDNWAFQLLADQIHFEAIKHGVHYGDNTDKIMFSKTAIYFIQKFRELIKTFDVQ